MDEVEFITIEDNGTDLILSFSFKESDEFGIDGFIIQRSPKFEFALMPEERGPSIDWTEDDEVITLKEVVISKKVIRIKTKSDFYPFDLSKLDEKDIQRLIDMLEKMNFDKVFKFFVL